LRSNPESNKQDWIASSQALLAMTVLAFSAKSLRVIASAAKQSRKQQGRLDCFVARAPRNDGVSVFGQISPRHCELLRSNPESNKEDWIASSQGLLAMTALMLRPNCQRHCERSEAIQKATSKTGLLRRKRSSQ
jgi:hypothetical protein